MLFPSILAGLVGFLMVTLTFYISTIQKLPLFASLKAIGAANGELVFSCSGPGGDRLRAGLGRGGRMPVAGADDPARSTTIAVVITPKLVLAGAVSLLLFSVIGSFLSVRRVATTDPGTAFRT